MCERQAAHLEGGSEVFVLRTCDVWILSQEQETFGQCVDKAVGDIRVTALRRNEVPDVGQVALASGPTLCAIQSGRLWSAARRSRPLDFTSLASSRIDWLVIGRPSTPGVRLSGGFEG
jgi:hypothetical protein